MKFIVLGSKIKIMVIECLFIKNVEILVRDCFDLG